MNRIGRVLHRILVLTGVSGLACIVLLVIINIVARTVFRSPILWSLEITGALVVWFTFILFGVDFLEDKHFSIDALALLLPDRGQQLLGLVAKIVTLIALGFLGYSCFEANRINGRMTLAATSLTLRYAFYLPLGIGIITYVLFIIFKLLRLGTSTKSSNRKDRKQVSV